jgi:type II secretory pathway component PulF
MGQGLGCYWIFELLMSFICGNVFGMDFNVLKVYKVSIFAGHPKLNRKMLLVGENPEEVRQAAAALDDETVVISAADPIEHFTTMRFGKKTPSTKQTRDFFIALAKAQESGLRIVPSLSFSMALVNNPFFRLAIVRVIRQIQLEGKSIAAAMESTGMFKKEHLAMIAAGEESGELPAILKRLAIALEKKAKVMSKLISAMIYPCLVMILALAAMLWVSWKFVPAIDALYQSFNVPLPLPTRIMVGINNFIVSYPWVFLVLGYGVRRFFKAWPLLYAQPAVQRIVLEWTGPIGKLLFKVYLASMFESLALLSKAGVPLQKAYALVADMLTCHDLRTLMTTLRLELSAGKSVFKSINDNRFYLGSHGYYISSYLRLGEETGEVSEVFDKLAVLYADEVDTAMANIDKILEPIILAILAAIVTFLMIAVYFPIFALGKHIMPGAKK